MIYAKSKTKLGAKSRIKKGAKIQKNLTLPFLHFEFSSSYLSSSGHDAAAAATAAAADGDLSSGITNSIYSSRLF